METYNPDEFKEIFESQIGQSIWEYLNSDDGKAKMQTASDLGQPAEGAVNDVLFTQFGKEMNEYDVHEAISHMVKHIMESLDYRLIERKQHSFRNLFPIWSTRYSKSKYPRSVMDIIQIGRTQVFKPYKTWLERKDTNDAIFDICFDGSDAIVEITGKAVFEDFETTESDPKIERKIFAPGSHYTIIFDLTVDDIYLRINNFYINILEKCLGKTIEDQEVILFGENSFYSLKPGLIENSAVYIRYLPVVPTQVQLDDLVKQIIFGGILEYAYHAKDDYGVEMGQYAKVLGKKKPHSRC